MMSEEVDSGVDVIDKKSMIYRQVVPRLVNELKETESLNGIEKRETLRDDVKL